MEVLRKWLWPFSWIYAGVTYLRNKAYDWGWLASESFPVPILCVGNLSVGGTGKTPMVEWLLQACAARKVAVLSRGYGRKSTGFQRVTAASTADQVGDEPLQIALKFPGAVVAVDANRRRGIRRLLETEAPDLILLDDAFQHRRVSPSASILLTAYDALYTDQGYLPSGDLRDHRSQAKRADVIIVTKCPRSLTEADRLQVEQALRPREGQILLFAHLQYDAIRESSGAEVAEDRYKAVPLTLVTGIAKPGPLLEHLGQSAIRFDHLSFPDHHRFTAGDLQRISKAGQVLTTEKDAVRLAGTLESFWVIGVKHRFSPEDRERLLAFLSRF